MECFDYAFARRRPIWADLVLAILILLAAVATALASVGPARAGVSVLDYPPGTVVISQAERKLYLIGEENQVLSYSVAVGRVGKQWHGEVHIDGKYINPAWAPPVEVKRAEPWLPDYIPGGSPRNPMGVRALTLSGDQYAIHGTNRPDSIGRAASFGCIRMRNHDIVDLYGSGQRGYAGHHAPLSGRNLRKLCYVH